MLDNFQNIIFTGITDPGQFETLAIDIFRFQVKKCVPYRKYVTWLGVEPAAVRHVDDIPHLPVELFKTYRIWSAESDRVPDVVFTSSGTTSNETSRHEVAFSELYNQSFTCGFEYFYGSAESWSIFVLLPSYLERDGSSLVWMMERLQAENKSHGGFYLYDYDKLTVELQKAVQAGEKVLLFGVAFALLDYAAYLEAQGVCMALPPNAVVMETGGMKGRRREVSRTEMHETLCRIFGVRAVHSEYGMTELLSQAYSAGEGIFRCPPWKQVRIRDLQNPLSELPSGRVGGIDVVDLANLWSCSFLAIQDLGVSYADGSFSVLGRIKGAQLRGCNMLIE